MTKYEIQCILDNAISNYDDGICEYNIEQVNRDTKDLQRLKDFINSLPDRYFNT